MTAFLGGVLIGLSATLLLLFNNKILGISGILRNGVFKADDGDKTWRLSFLGGLILGGFFWIAVNPSVFAEPVNSNLFITLLAGVLVGYGTSLSNGCTSGHGVCGISRFSIRSLVATATFIAAGMATVFLVKHL